MMSMKKTVVAIATVAVAQSTGVQANCCMSCPCSEDVAPIDDPKKEVNKPVEPTPTPVQPEEPTRMQKCKNAVNARVADCKNGAENCKDRMVNGAETAKNGVKNGVETTKNGVKNTFESAKTGCESGVESTKTGVKSAFRKVAAAPKEVKNFAMENPKKCIAYSAATVASGAALFFQGKPAFEFLAKNFTVCSAELQKLVKNVQTPQWFTKVQGTVSKCFKNTTKEFKGEEEKLFSETRAWFNNFFNNLTKDVSMKKALNSAESTVKSALNNGVQKFETVSKHVPYTTNTKVQKAVTGVAAAVAVPASVKAAQKTYEVTKPVVKSAYTATKEGCQNAGKHCATAKTAVANNVVTPVSNFAGRAVDTAMKPVRSVAGVAQAGCKNAVAGVQSLAGKASKKAKALCKRN